MTRRQYLVALYAFIPFGPARIQALLSFFENPKNVWNADRKSLIDVGLKKKTVDEFFKHKDNFNSENYFNTLDKLGIGYITIDDNVYPENLKNLTNAPIVLYIKGKLSRNDTNSVAIVGSRKMTSYGKEVAELFSGELASCGATIISGLARGIDTTAHKAAIVAGGRTIAVLGCGLNTIYPSENSGLAKKIVETGGAIISEYPLDYPTLRTNFANRNRIISGISAAVLVVEGAKKSGTLLTASHAAEQGRQVFAVPGQITSPLSGAPHFLIQNGAKFAFSPKDIIEELDLQFQVDKEKIEKVMPSDKDEKKLLELLENEPLHLDEIVRISKISTNEVSSRLTIMELKGLVKNQGGGKYKKI